MRPADKILSRLDAVRKNGDHKWMARCPAHADNGPSLSIRELDGGKVLVHCFAGCGGADVMAAIGLALSDLYPERPATEYQGRDDWNPRKKPAKFVEELMQDEIWRLRARLGAK